MFTPPSTSQVGIALPGKLYRLRNLPCYSAVNFAYAVQDFAFAYSFIHQYND